MRKVSQQNSSKIGLKRFEIKCRNTSCKLHGSPKHQSTSTGSTLQRVNVLDLMENVPLAYCNDINSTSSLTTPLNESNKILAPRRPQKCKTTENASLCGSINGICNCDEIVGERSSYSQQQQSTSASHSHPTLMNHAFNHQPNQIGQSGLRHRWQQCPELHKAMDGVNYIADHTRKEEESTKVT